MGAWPYHLTWLAPVAVTLLLLQLFRQPASLTGVSAVVGLLSSSVTFLLIRPGLQRIFSRPLTGVGLLLSGVVLVAVTPMLVLQQFAGVAESGPEATAPAIPWLLAAIVALCAGALVVWTAHRLTELPQVLTPLPLAAGGLLVVAVLEGRWLRVAVALILGLLLWVAWEDLYRAFRQPSRHLAASSANITSNLGLVSYFFFSVGLLWLEIFLGFPLWLAALLLAGVAALLTYQAMWLLGCTAWQGLPYVVAMTLVSIELLWAVSFLPTGIYVGALVLTAAYYVAAGLARNQMHGSLTRRVLFRYLLLGAAAFAGVLLTAKWQ